VPTVRGARRPSVSQALSQLGTRHRTQTVTFSAQDAARPFLTANERIWESFESEVRKRLSELEVGSSMTERVRAALLELLPVGTHELLPRRVVVEGLEQLTAPVRRDPDGWKQPESARGRRSAVSVTTANRLSSLYIRCSTNRELASSLPYRTVPAQDWVPALPQAHRFIPQVQTNWSIVSR
jgi:hypothetical protein